MIPTVLSPKSIPAVGAGVPPTRSEAEPWVLQPVVGGNKARRVPTSALLGQRLNVCYF